MLDKYVRSGDVWLHRVLDKVSLTKEFETGMAFELAKGTVTGHSHRILSPKDPIKRWKDGEITYLEVPEGAYLLHEEHNRGEPQPLSAGIYKQVQERHFDVIKEVIEAVQD